jgi:hypothetical protein
MMIEASALATVTGGDQCGELFDGAVEAHRLSENPPFGFSELGKSYDRSAARLFEQGITCKMRQRGIDPSKL